MSDSLEPLPPSAIEPVNRLLADLEAAKTVPEVRLIFDRAEALYDAAKRARVAEDQLRLYAAISLKAQRRGGGGRSTTHLYRRARPSARCDGRTEDSAA